MFDLAQASEVAAPSRALRLPAFGDAIGDTRLVPIEALIADPVIVPAPSGGDDADAIEAAVEKWLGTVDDSGVLSPGVLVFQRGSYRIGRTITVSPSVNCRGGLVFGYGANLTSTGSPLTGLRFRTSAGVAWAGLRVCGLQIRNTKLLLSGYDNDAGGLYRVGLVDIIGRLTVDADQPVVHVAGAFEVDIVNPSLSSSSTTAASLYVTNSDLATATASSIGVHGGTISGGSYGLHCDEYGVDVSVFGGSYLLTRSFGIYLKSNYSTVVGAHVENACMASGNAGIYLDGGGLLAGCVGVARSDLSAQKYLYRCFAGSGQGVAIVAGYHSTNIPAAKGAFVDGGGNHDVTINNCTFDSTANVAGRLSVMGLGRVTGGAGVGVGNSAAATTPGSVTRKMEVFDASGASLGFVPIYDTIT
jgi:hypothetical protein